MSGPNHNITTQQVLTSDISTIEIYSAAQMPLELAPDGIMRWKPSLGTKYIFHGGIVLPRTWIPKSVSPAEVELIEFSTNFQGASLLLSGDSTPHIWGRDVSSLIFRNVNIFDSTPQSTNLFDLVGVGSFSTLALISSPIFNAQDLGHLVNMNITHTNSSFVNTERGLSIRNSNGSSLNSINTFRFANLSAVTMQSPYLCFLGDHGTSSITSGSISTTSGDTSFCIDSTATGAFDIVGNSFDGVGNFFHLSTPTAVTAFTIDDLSITSFSDSTVNPGVDTTVNFATVPDISIGQVVRIADEVAYDGVHTVVRVSDDQLSFDINVVHSTSGAGTLKRTRVTSTSHMISRDETCIISGTTNYNGTFSVLKLIDNNNFLIPETFVADDATGTATFSGSDEKSLGVTAVLNGAAANSRVVGLGKMNGNSTATTVALADTYQAIDVSTVANDSISERFTLTDATAGIYRYDGVSPIVAVILALPSVIKTGATANYRFVVTVNGAIPTFASTSYAPLEVKTTKVSTTVVETVNLVTNDTIQILVAGDSTSDNITISDFLIEVKQA